MSKKKVFRGLQNKNMDWKQIQEENRRLLKESLQTRNERNTRNFGEEIQLSKINRARAQAIAKIAVSKFENMALKDAEAAAFEYLQIFKKETPTDDQVLTEITKGKVKKRSIPKPTTEQIRETQSELFEKEPARKLHFVLPYPPSANRYWRHAAIYSKDAGKWIAVTYLSDEAKIYKQVIKLFAKNHKIKPLLNNVVLTAYVYRPQKSGDLGNRLKVVEDALEEIAYINDNQICESHHYRRDDKTRPRVEVFIEEVN